MKLPQECIGCQKKVAVTFATVDDMIANDGIVYCADCKPPKPSSLPQNEECGHGPE